MLDRPGGPLSRLLHRHAPEATGVIVTAGFRKENLIRGTWAFVSTGELLRCRCGRQFFEVMIRDRRRIVEIEGGPESAWHLLN